MLADVPEWLIQAYVRSVQSAGSPLSKEQLSEACHRLIDTWSSPDRAYHGLSHVVDVLTRLETLLPETHEPALVRLAAWYHGIAFSTSAEDTYMRQSGENVPSSATAAEYHLKDLGVDSVKAARVAALIRGLKRTDLKNASETAAFHAIDVDELALRDAHLATLAVDPQRYKKYLELIGKEYAHIPFDDFLRARKEIVSKILTRRQLFVTPLAKEWDVAARENLEAELERINLALSRRESENAPHTSAATAPSARSADSGSPDPKIAPLLAASAQADAEEAAVKARAAARLCHTVDQELSATRPADVLSSMETCVDKADPGVRPVGPLTSEQKKQRRREEVAEEMRRRIAERHKAADAFRQEKERQTDQAHGPSHAHPAGMEEAHSAVSAETPASAPTPPSADPHPTIPTHGIEREPGI